MLNFEARTATEPLLHAIREDWVDGLAVCDTSAIGSYVNHAIQHGSVQVMKYMYEHKALYPYTALARAAEFGNIPSMEYINTLPISLADYLDNALWYAIDNNQLPAVQWLVEHGVSDLEEALSCAARNNNIPVMVYLVSRGASDLHKAIISTEWYARINGVRNQEAISWLRQRVTT